MGKLIDMTGQRCGALTVIGRHDTDTGRPRWRCRCDCGKECVADGYHLRRGNITSCGCGLVRAAHRRGKDTGAHVDYTGQTFGRLTAVRWVSKGVWLWRCACGKETLAKPADVKHGKPASCGCGLAEATGRRVREDNVLQHYDGTCVTALRAITRGKLRSNNTTGHTGITVRHNVAGDVYVANIMLRGKNIYLGRFADLDSAITARRDAERKYFGQVIAEYDFAHCTDDDNDDTD